MIKQNILLLAAVAVIGCMSGCSCDSIGSSPPGLSADEMRATFDKLPLDQRSNQLLDVPGPMGDKRTRIEGWYKAAGQPIPDAIQKRLGESGGPGAPTAG